MIIFDHKKYFFLLLMTFLGSKVVARPLIENGLDSLLTKIQSEVKSFPIDKSEMFTEAPGLKSMIDSAYPHLKSVLERDRSRKLSNAMRSEEIVGFRYPLILNESLLVQTIRKNKETMFFNGTNTWTRVKSDTISGRNNFLRLRLFDGNEIVALCDAIVSSGSDLWTGHVSGYPGSHVRVSVHREGKVNSSVTVRIEGIRQSYQEISSAPGVSWFTIREANIIPYSGPEDGLPEN